MEKNKEAKEVDLGTGSVGKLLFQLALPAITAQIINVLYNMVDRMYIGHLPGEGANALTGVGVTFPVIMAISAFAALVSMGGAPRASIMLGKGRKDEAENILGNCTTALITVAVVLTAFFLIFGRRILLMFGASGNTIEYGWAYMQIYSLGTIFVQLALGLNAFINAQGYAKTGMYTVLIGAICNIILDPILMFVFHMGVRGAALATIISQGISAAWVVLFLISNKSYLKIRTCFMRPKREILMPAIALGAAPFVMQFTESILNICFNTSLLKYGGDVAVGAMTIMGSVMQFSLLPLQGLTQGAQPIISFNYGARKFRRVREAYLKAVLIATMISTLSFLCFQLIPRQIIGIFGSGSEEYFHFAEQYFRIFLFFTFLNGLQPITANYFTSIGKAAKGIFISLTRQIIFLLPLIVVLPMFLGIEGVMYSAPVADLMAALLALVFVTRELRRMRGMEEEMNCGAETAD